MELPTQLYVIWHGGHIRRILEGPEGMDPVKEFMRWYELSDWKAVLDPTSEDQRFVARIASEERMEITYRELVDLFVGYLTRELGWITWDYEEYTL